MAKRQGRPSEVENGVVKYVRLPEAAIDDLLKLQYLRHGTEISTLIRVSVLEYLERPDVQQELQRLRVVE